MALGVETSPVGLSSHDLIPPMRSPSPIPEENAGPDRNRPVSLREGGTPSFYSDSEMVGRIREHEWADTPLGSIEDWSRELGHAVDLMLGADEAISIFWAADHILLYNDAWRAFIGDKHPEALGKPGREVFPEIWETIGPKLDDVLAGTGAASECEQRLTLKRDGDFEDTWFDYSFNPIVRADGAVGGVLNIGSEVTERVVIEEALRESEEFHRLAAEAGNVGTWSIDLETGEAVLSPRMAALLGYASDEHVASGRPEFSHWQHRVSKTDWMAVVHPGDREAIEQVVVDARAGDRPFELEFRVQHEDEIRWLYARGEVKADEDPVLRGASVDTTERHELEEALVGATEAVRRDIGRELHDVLSSDLAALAMKAENLRATLRREAASSEEGSTADPRWEEAEEMLDEIAEGVRSAAKQSRDLSHLLMPVALQEEHLAAALQHLCCEQAELGEPSPVFEGDREEFLPENKETAMHLYRIAREAIINAQRHANADRIGVRLGRDEDTLVLTVRDNGDGLPETTDLREGIGLRTMAHRADLIGATVQVESADDGGTVVRCRLPLSKANGDTATGGGLELKQNSPRVDTS